MTEESLRSLRPWVVCLSHSWGGLEQVAASDSIELALAGVSVQVLVYSGSPLDLFLADEMKNRGAEFLLQIERIDFTPRNHFDWSMRKLIRDRISQGFNIIHAHQTSILGSILPWVWNERRVAVVATRHILNNHDKRGLYHRLLYSRLNCLFAISQTVRRNILATHSIRRSKVEVVLLGLDFARFDPDRASPERYRKEWGADEDTLVIGMVGRIDPAKGQGTFIKAAAGLLKSLRPGEKVKFVVVGEETLGGGGGYLQVLKNMVSQFRIQSNVVFAGYQSDIPEVMRAFDVFVMPSRQEAFGLVAIEAMAMECPIVISSSGSAEEIVGAKQLDGTHEFGLTIRPDDPFDLQRQLRRLMDNPLERIRMGKRAREYVREHYDKRLRIRRTLDLYLRNCPLTVGSWNTS